GQWITNEGSKEEKNPECRRSFEPMLGNKFIKLEVLWKLTTKDYLDHTLIGLNRKKEICFWSFTSDGKNSQGILTDVSDIHPAAIGFVAEMPAGTARQAYWPDEEDGFFWVVESKTKKGWNRFVKQQFKAIK
ncbi:MAG: hypothetical protein AAFN93_28960, partial [Bacteroidota bacterium]